MTGLVRKATILAVLGLLATVSLAAAGIPDAGQSVLPAGMNLVGCKTGVIDPLGAFTITVNDAAGNPVAGCEVKIVFNADLYIYSTITGLTVDCDNNAVTTTSDASGVASFNIPGATINTNGVAAGSGLGGAAVFACEVPLGTLIVGCYDENGAVTTLGVGAADLSGWLGDFGKQGTIGYKGRSDFDWSTTVAAKDLSYWLKCFGQGNSASACGTLCP